MTSKYFDAMRQALEKFNASHVQSIRKRLGENEVGSEAHRKAYADYYDIANRVYDPGSYVMDGHTFSEEVSKEFDNIVDHHPVTALHTKMVEAGCDAELTEELLALIDDLGY